MRTIDLLWRQSLYIILFLFILFSFEAALSDQLLVQIFDVEILIKFVFRFDLLVVILQFLIMKLRHFSLLSQKLFLAQNTNVEFFLRRSQILLKKFILIPILDLKKTDNHQNNQ